MEFAIPSDERDYRADKEIVGCNRIFCRLCKSWVKHIDAHRVWGYQLERNEHEQLYESLDPKRFPALRSDPDWDGFRTYLCRCTWADTPGLKRLCYGDIDGWGCAGHPGAWR